MSASASKPNRGSAAVAGPSQAITALEWAAARAESATTAKAPQQASKEDFQEATRRAVAEVRTRLDRILMGEDPESGLNALLACGALEALLPAVYRLVGFGDDEWRHKDVWKHTKQVVHQATPRLAVRWAALLHDIGKVRTRAISPGGQVSFHGHAEVGARMFDKWERRLGLFEDEPELRRAIRFLVLHHLRASQYKRSWTDSAVRRFARDMGARLDDLICLSRADITTKRQERRRRGLQQINELCDRVAELAKQDAEQPPLPTGVGNEIMAAFNLKPSRQIGEIKRLLEAKVKTGALPAQAEAAVYLEHIAQHRDEFGL